MNPAIAPGKPGVLPRWNSGYKSGIGTSTQHFNCVWFTLADGILTEVYYPSVDQATIRSLEFYVTCGSDYFSSEQQDTTHTTTYTEPGIPAYKIINTAKDERYRIIKTVYCDPDREALLLNVEFESLKGKLEDYHLYLYLNPHLDNSKEGNDAWIGHYKTLPVFYAKGEKHALALASSVPFKIRTCGYVGFSDGLKDIQTHKRLTSSYIRAEDGNVGMMGEIDLHESHGRFTISLGFGTNPAEAGLITTQVLLGNPKKAFDCFVTSWKEAQSIYKELGREDEALSDLYRSSIIVLQTQMTKRFQGAIIPSLSIPWGESKAGVDISGYHLVRTRDLVECAWGFMAGDDLQNARTVLLYLISTQESEGYWFQSMQADGTPYGNTVRLEDVSLPILLADRLKRLNALQDLDPWPMIKKATSYLIANGPISHANCNPFNIATQIAALLTAADYFESQNYGNSAQFIRETADLWYDYIDTWLYLKGSELGAQGNVEGYYIRAQGAEEKAVTTETLALVRYGLRSPNDPRILNSIKMIDATLKTDTRTGPVWHRYSGDGYGEHRDGSPFDGIGIGRGWPLLAGKRGHYELAKGDKEAAEELLKVICKQAGETQLIPEQIWDDLDIPEKHLYNGLPTGAAMPLAAAHAEYIQLLRSIADQQVFDQPVQPIQRYQNVKSASPYALWRFNHKIAKIPKGKSLRIETLAETSVRWSADEWKTWQDAHSADTDLGIHHVDIPTSKLEKGAHVVFTFHWIDSDSWEGTDFTLGVDS